MITFGKEKVKILAHDQNDPRNWSRYFEKNI